MKRTVVALNLILFFVRTGNKPDLEKFMTSMVHYTKIGSTASDQKAGFAVLTKVVAVWVPGKILSSGPNGSPLKNGLPSPDLAIDGLQQFFYDNVVPLCFELPLRKDFDYSDAASYQVGSKVDSVIDQLIQRLSFPQALSDMALFLKTLAVKREQEFADQMANVIFPSLGYPPDKAQEFLAALASSPECV